MICFFALHFLNKRGMHGRNSFRTPQCTVSHQKVDTLHSSITQEMRAICLKSRLSLHLPSGEVVLRHGELNGLGLGSLPSLQRPAEDAALRRPAQRGPVHPLGRAGEALWGKTRKGSFHWSAAWTKYFWQINEPWCSQFLAFHANLRHSFCLFQPLLRQSFCLFTPLGRAGEWGVICGKTRTHFVQWPAAGANNNCNLIISKKNGDNFCTEVVSSL